MKIKNIDIPIYEFSLKLISIDGPDDSKEIRPHLIDIGCDDDEIESILANIINDVKDGGLTYRNLSNKKIIIILYRCTSENKRINIIGHEKRHVEDRILDYVCVDDIEAAAYLAGYLSEKLFCDE